MKLLAKLKSYFPSNLPIGLTEFNTWADEVIELTGQLADYDSMRFALASMIIHVDAKKAAVPKQYFVRTLRKSAANQVASYVFQEIKQKQAEQQKLEEQAKTSNQVEATAGRIPVDGQG